MWKTDSSECRSSVDFGQVQPPQQPGAAVRSSFGTADRAHIRSDGDGGSSSNSSGAVLQASGSSYSVTQKQMCSAPAADNELELHLHQVVLPGLVSCIEPVFQPERAKDSPLLTIDATL